MRARVRAIGSASIARLILHLGEPLCLLNIESCFSSRSDYCRPQCRAKRQVKEINQGAEMWRHDKDRGRSTIVAGSDIGH